MRIFFFMLLTWGVIIASPIVSFVFLRSIYPALPLMISIAVAVALFFSPCYSANGWRDLLTRFSIECSGPKIRFQMMSLSSLQRTPSLRTIGYHCNNSNAWFFFCFI